MVVFSSSAAMVCEPTQGAGATGVLELAVLTAEGDLAGTSGLSASVR